MTESTKQQPSARHFPYQHPTFGTRLRPADVSKWKGTVYYWWWVYLKENVLYAQTCRSQGEGNLAVLFQDFGDVSGDDFKAWWMDGGRGVRLFAEPRAEDMVRILQPGDQVQPVDEVLTISLPLNFPKRFLEQRLKVLLAANHHGKRGVQYAKQSKAKYVAQGQPNIPALQMGMTVWRMKKERPDLSLWEVGDRIPGLLRTQKIKEKDDSYEVMAKRRALAATVSRYLRRVEESIHRTSLGLFP